MEKKMNILTSIQNIHSFVSSICFSIHSLHSVTSVRSTTTSSYLPYIHALHCCYTYNTHSPGSTIAGLAFTMLIRRFLPTTTLLCVRTNTTHLLYGIKAFRAHDLCVYNFSDCRRMRSRYACACCYKRTHSHTRTHTCTAAHYNGRICPSRSRFTFILIDAFKAHALRVILRLFVEPSTCFFRSVP